MSAGLNWAIQSAEGLWFNLANRPPDTDFVIGFSKLLRKTRSQAISHARGRFKVLLHRPEFDLTEDQKAKIFKALERIK